jgi:asparagine synthetase B (glutamine-hydrolysing)
MCGIVGILAKNTYGFYYSQVSVFKEMLFADQLRGSDGTGIIYNNGKSVHALKAPVPSSIFLQDPLVKIAMDSLSKDALFAVGHNRSATIGKSSHLHTHPHRHKHITLIHNGTLSSHKELADVESDSLAICQSIAIIGAEKTIEKINGAFALVWYDSNDKSINICRNTERPLFLLEASNCYFIASEPDMVQWIVKRNKIHITSCLSFEPGILYKYKLDDLQFTKTNVKLQKNAYSYSKKGGGVIHSYWDFDTTTSEPPNGVSLSIPLPYPIGEIYPTKEKEDKKKLGSLICFRPQRVIQCDNKTEYYIEGLNIEGTDIRVYSNDKNYLSLLNTSSSLVGELKAVACIKGKTVYFLKEVRQSFDKSKRNIN